MRKKLSFNTNNMENINELSLNLPDYIEGRIEDTALKRRIEDELNVNEAFRAEYEEMKSAFAFLGNTELEAPPTGYFNNLLPKINERISAREEAQGETILQKILSYWKVLIPVLPLVLIFIVYKTYFMNPGTTVPAEEEKIQQIQPPQIKDEKTPVITETTTQEKVDETGTLSRQQGDSNNNRRNNYRTEESVPVTQQQASENVSAVTSEAAIDEMVENSPYVEESDDIESEFEQLDEEEQEDLLTKLQNTDF
jgi:hypothetical protein